MKFTIDRQEKYNTLQLNEEKLDTIISPELKSEFQTILAQGIEHLIVDLSSVKYIDSSGLSALLVGNRIFDETGGIFILSGILDHVMKLINISQLDKVLNIVPTVEEGVKDILLIDLGQGLANKGK